MDNKTSPEERLADEFQVLGKNLVEALRAAWENPERKRIQQEVETGLLELGDTLKREAENFSNSPTGQQIKEEVTKIGNQLNESQAPEKIRQELLNALQIANTELQKVISRWTPTDQDNTQATSEHPEEE